MMTETMHTRGQKANNVIVHHKSTHTSLVISSVWAETSLHSDDANQTRLIPRHRGYKTFSMLKAIELEILTAHEN